MSEPERQPSSRSTRLAVVGIALTILLGVVAFVSKGHVSPAGTSAQDRGISQALANAVFTIFVVAMVAGAFLMIYMQSARKRASNRAQFRLKPLLFSLGFFAAVVIGMVIAYHHLGHKNPNAPLAHIRSGNKAGLSKSAKHKLKAAQNPHSPSFNWYLAGGIFALIFALSLTTLIASNRRRSKLVREVTVTKELLAMLDETLDDLRNEADPRKAVIAAYARMERILAAHDLARRPSEAPLEYLARVLVDLRVTEEAASKLTALFERAKFSEHEIGVDAKEEAIDALVALRDQLRVIDRYEDPPKLHPTEVPSGTA
jgi:Domain of unknown function (DUF4129)